LEFGTSYFVTRDGSHLRLELPPEDAHPDEIAPLVAVSLEVGDKALYDVGFGCEKVDGVHRRVWLSLVLNQLDIYWALAVPGYRFGPDAAY